MVTRRSLSDCSTSTTSDPNDEDQDTASVATSEEGGCSNDGQVVLAEDIHREKPSFGNVSVANSSDIHFGNKTYYQGPVTIKQFLYANPQLANGYVSESGDGTLAIENDSLVLDSAPVSSSVGNDNPSFVTDKPDNIGIKVRTNIDNKLSVEPPHPQVRKGTRWLRNVSRQHAFLVVSLAAVLLVSLVTLMTVLLTRHQPVTTKPQTPVYGVDSPEQEKATPVEYPIDPQVNLTLPGKLKIVSRKEWLAQPPVEAATPLQLPVHFVIISHTATENCTDQPACTFHVRYIQMFHIESKNWWDIGYNFLVGGDGYAYEGRGWKSEGAHTYGYNSKSIGIAFIGTFNQMLPPERQILAAKQLIEKGVELGYLAKDYKVLAARQLGNTQSPGLMLYENIKTWANWVETP